MLERYKQDLELIKQGKLPKLTTDEQKNTTKLNSQEIKKNMDLIKQDKLPKLQRENGNMFGLQYINASGKSKNEKATEKQR